MVAVSGATVYAVCTVASSFAVAYLVDDVVMPAFSIGPSVSNYVVGSALIVGIGLLRAVGVIVRRSFAGITQWRTVSTLSLLVARKISRQPHEWHRQRMTGDMIARAGVDAEAATSVLAPLPFGTSVVVLLLVSGLWLVATDVVLGGIALTVIPFLVVMNVVYHRLVEGHYSEAQRFLGEFSEAVYESLEGVSVTKAFGAEDRETARMSSISTNLREARSRAVRIRASFEGLLDALPSLVNVLILALGALRVRDGFLSVGELSGFIYLFTLLVFPLRIIGYVLSEIPHSLSGWLRLREVLDQDQMVDPRSLLRTCQKPTAISARGLSYRFPDSDNDAIRDITFDVESGSVVAIVGSTGSGKTTLLRLLAGSLTPGAGYVCVSETASSMVLQDPFVFSGTIRENIELSPTSQGGLDQAMYVASLQDFVNSLPQGVNTEVGERGVTMSGGQRQRLALARSIATDSRLLLIDDTTSALDPATENVVLERIASMKPRRTVIMVAARPSAVALADSVLFIEEGKLVDQGHPRDLLERNERFREQMQSYQVDRSSIVIGEGNRHVD